MLLSAKYKTRLLLGSIIIFLLLYWSYLAYVTQPVIVYDAKAYQQMGQLIYEKGWKEYFVTGPNREPLYPLLVAASMHLAGQYTYVNALKVFQLFLLIVSGFLMLNLLKRSLFSKRILVVAILYFGISPAIINSVFSMFSEGATYSAILAIVLVGSAAWNSFDQNDSSGTFRLGLCFGGAFLVITMFKGIYEMIFPLVLIPFIVYAIKSWQVKNQTAFKNVVLFILGTLLVFMSCLSAYKFLNKKYNGVYALTDRAGWVFYGSTARRVMPLDGEKTGALLARTFFEEDGCKKFFSSESCEAWHVRTTEALGAEKNYEVIAKYPPWEHNSQLFKAGFGKIFENPIQYGLLTFLEWLHIFFWETTQIGFVVYPDWLEAVFNFGPLAKALRFVVGLLSLSAIVYGVLYILKNRKSLFEPRAQGAREDTILFFTTYIIFWHTALYSLFAIVPRHAVPIAPLMVLLIAIVAQRVGFNSKRQA